MSLIDLDTNRQKTQMLLKSLFSLFCMFCLNFAGCKSESVPVTVHPLQDDVKQLTESPHSEDSATSRIEQLSITDTSLAAKNEPMALTAFPIPETANNNSKASRYTSKIIEAGERNIPTAVKPEIYSPGEILAETESVITTQERPSSGPDINIPVLNEPGMADELISVNFDQVEIRTILKTIGDITGINFVVDDTVRGTVTVMSPTKIRLGDIYNFLESILEVHGYAAVPAAGDLVKIVPRAEAVKRNLQVRIGSNPAEIPRNDSVVTQIIPLNYAKATEVSQIIQPRLATGAQMAVYPRTNSIVITDASSNIHHIAKIIQKLDISGSKEQLTVFSLNYASAQVLSEQITRIMQKSKLASSQAGRTLSMPQIETDIKILPDVRTNSLIAVANTQDTETIDRLVKQLDVQRPIGANNVHVVYLKNARAKEVAESLTGALANLKIAVALEATQPVHVTADEGTNALIITASPQDFEVIAEIIDKLDIVREQVLVEMFIVEVSEDGLKEVGIDWATLDQAITGSVRFFGATNFGPRVDFASGDLEGMSIGAWKKTGSDTSIGPILHALEKKSGVNILSTPHILTSNHNKARIIVGENIPFVIKSRITEPDPATPTVIKTFEYKDVGITLEITPHISQGGLVRLEIDSEFTKLVETVTTSTDTPTTAKRQAQTVVTMNSGSTVVIGGLIRDDKVTIDKKVPFVADIPLIGGLFKFKRDQLQKTNLLIFITPHVMASQQDLDQITEEKKKEMMPVLEELKKNNTKR